MSQCFYAMWKNEIKSRFGKDCLIDEPLAPFTGYKIGGNADALVFPQASGDWKWLVHFCRSKNIQFTVIGCGSNVLVADSGIRGITASTRHVKKINISRQRVTAQAGALLDMVVLETIKAGLKGIECLSGIPGSVGGGVWMNAGAFDQEIFDRLVSFEVISQDGNIRKLSKKDVKCGYRCVDGLKGFIILSAEWELVKGDKAGLIKTRETVLETREDRHPLEYPSAGSVFKRPKGDYASRLIDISGFKCARVGDAQVSVKHAGFIVNLGHARAIDVYELINKVRAGVKAKTGVDLELEQVLLGDIDEKHLSNSSSGRSRKRF